MPQRIEDYALIGDCQTAALVGRNGSIDWLCLPRFDSPACFASLLGGPQHGHWTIAPRGRPHSVRRAYRDGSLILDTTFETDEGAVTLTDFMPIRGEVPRVVRVVRGQRGRTPMRTQAAFRFDYGSVVPWVRKAGKTAVHAIAGPDSLRLQSEIPLRGENMTTVADFDVVEGQTRSFVLTWHPSHTGEPLPVDALDALRETERTWKRWASQCSYEGEWDADVRRSLVTLKALTDSRTGAIVAAPTTSLPEELGGVRNWDYRYCWVRDATFTLLSLVHNGFLEEAQAWREWLLRAVAGDPSKLQIMYAVDGARRLEEREIPWLPGYEGSRPVRVGNAAFEQRQLDVYGEVIDALYQCDRYGIAPALDAWKLQRKLLEFLESGWQEADDGIWEVRGPRRHFTHSKVMAWVAFDRALRIVEKADSGEPVAQWRALRDRIHDDVCRQGFDAKLGSFVQSFGSKRLDASLLMIPLVGFLPAADERVRGTVHAIESHLMRDGFVRRYDNDPEVEALPTGEGVFLPCSFWLADNWALVGRHAEARELFERLLTLRNDVGLLSEEYDVAKRRLVGNFPQAFSHVSLINTALNLTPSQDSPARSRL
ncbi:MAG TPA: glycoside hydrolase family 15 protein [Polyangiaceae bacterium]|nr:glycoside hydrolase family 15 protein [Polyangiaceae bacterium]